MKENKKLNFQLNTGTTLLLFVLNGLFIAYLVLLAFYNRLSQDDYIFLKSERIYGFMNVLKESYFFHSGRFTQTIFSSIIFFFIDKNVHLIFIPLLVWIINYLILIFGIKRILNCNCFLSSNLAALFLNIFNPNFR